MQSPSFDQQAIGPMYSNSSQYLITTLHQTPSDDDISCKLIGQIDPVLLKLSQNTNAFSSVADGRMGPESAGADPTPSVSSGHARPPGSEGIDVENRYGLQSTQPPVLSPDAPASLHSGSVKYTTSVRALSPDGNIVESEIVRNYEIPGDALNEHSDHLIDEREQHGIWLDGLTGKRENESRPSLNLMTHLKVTRSPDGAHTVSDFSDKCIQGSSSIPLGASATTPVEETVKKSRTCLSPLHHGAEAPVTKAGAENRLDFREPEPEREGECDAEVSEYRPMIIEETNQLPSSCKINNAARADIIRLQRVLQDTCDDLETIQNGIIVRDFTPCIQFRDRIGLIPNILNELITKLDYSPYEKDLWEARDGIVRVLEEVQHQPALIMMRLVELGFYVYEIGSLLGEDVLPPCFAPMVHAIQTRIQRLSAGRIVRQIVYVPQTFDPVVATYYKDRRIERIENFCSCRVRLLNPSHPRAAFCPPDCRTLQVDFDPVRGKHVGFLDLLNRCLHPKHCYARIAATVMRRANGTELELKGHEVVDLRFSEPRPRLAEIRADICAGPKKRILAPGKGGDSDVLSKSTLV